MAKFDYEQWKAKWRERAAHFGIDPETGATGYQVCLVRAEMKRAECAAGRVSWRRPWWADSQLWLEGVADSDTEREAMANMREECKRYRPAPRVDGRPKDVIIREVWRESKREMAI